MFRKHAYRFFMLATAGLVLASLLLVSSCTKKGETLLISVASSLQNVFTEFKPAAEKASGHSIAFNFAGSGALRGQIEQGAAVDVFVSASAHEMERLMAAVPVEAASLITFLGNGLVVIGPPDAVPVQDKAQLRDRIDGARRFSIGDENTVPAGRYAEQALQTLGLRQAREGRVLLANSVRQVLAYVETGAVEYGFVFSTDAKASGDQDKSALVYAFADEDISDPIVYQAVVLERSLYPKGVRAFVQSLTSDGARSIFEAAGFRVP